MIPRDEVIGGPLERVLAGLAGFDGDDDDAGAVLLALRPALPHLDLRPAAEGEGVGEKGRREGRREGGGARGAIFATAAVRGGGSGGGRRPFRPI